jgi:peptidoglycan/xylan/chitin deacetylase (PgdA/CDA1 family)
VRGVCLMYHDVHEGDAPVADIAPGAARYHVSVQAFRQHLEIIGPACREGVVSLTFDDGWRGSLTTGLQCVVDAGMRATFFVTRDFVGRRHYAGPALLREAHAAGMEVGTHGATHRFLSTLPAHELREELSAAKSFLEDLLGTDVTTGSVPGGAWSTAVAEAAAESGYRALYTSRPGLNDEGTDPFALRRVPVRGGTTIAAVERFARLDVRREVARAAVLGAPRTILGRERYARVRARLLG